jgi:hypothetical protein
MSSLFENVLEKLFSGVDALLDANVLLGEGERTGALVGAFLLAAGGDDEGRRRLTEAAGSAEGGEAARFFLDALEAVRRETDEASSDPGFVRRLEALAASPGDPDLLRQVFFPEGAGLPGARAERVAALRQRRRVRIRELNPEPLSDPGRELLFTSNVLLTVPAPGTRIDELELGPELEERTRRAAAGSQLYWYDHPIPVGVRPESNEILHGLRGLDEAVAFERKRGNMPGGKAAVVLSVSVTHDGLHGVARPYIEAEIRKAGGFGNLDVYVFTESDTSRLVEEVLAPAAREAGGPEIGGEADPGLGVFGVDGEYGRHYSFLKAAAALWQAVKDPGVKATFKIDLDQVFPQAELVVQSGASAFEHFRTPLWGARGTDAAGREVELGMIAGALVNEKDIHRGLFTPDVPFPEDPPESLEERFFFSRMLMALSTEAEMGTRYGGEGLDGRTECLQRVHVTGGTNGILVESLLRHRPFTPSFVGRAEDQAYILSVLGNVGERLAYAHEDGLVMRHDKEAFAADAIKAAAVGKRIGDYVRILTFSAYARVLGGGDPGPVKALADPFTGCFVSRIPATVVMLRFSAKAAELYLSGNGGEAARFLFEGFPRLEKAMRFASDGLARRYRAEREGWDRYYGALERIRADGEPGGLRERAARILDACRVRA